MVVLFSLYFTEWKLLYAHESFHHFFLISKCCESFRRPCHFRHMKVNTSPAALIYIHEILCLIYHRATNYDDRRKSVWENEWKDENEQDSACVCVCVKSNCENECLRHPKGCLFHFMQATTHIERGIFRAFEMISFIKLPKHFFAWWCVIFSIDI